eukprot:318590_1
MAIFKYTYHLLISLSLLCEIILGSPEVYNNKIIAIESIGNFDGPGGGRYGCYLTYGAGDSSTVPSQYSNSYDVFWDCSCVEYRKDILDEWKWELGTVPQWTLSHIDGRITIYCADSIGYGIFDSNHPGDRNAFGMKYDYNIIKNQPLSIHDHSGNIFDITLSKEDNDYFRWFVVGQKDHLFERYDGKMVTGRSASFNDFETDLDGDRYQSNFMIYSFCGGENQECCGGENCDNGFECNWKTNLCVTADE